MKTAVNRENLPGAGSPDPRLEDDGTLVGNVLQGDVEAFSVLVRRYNQRLYRFARGLLGEDQEALDAVQEAYVRAFTHLRSLHHPEDFATWIHVITRNEAYAMLRKRSRETPTEAETMERIVDEAGEGSGATPDGVLEAARLRGMLEQAIDALPQPFRVVFVLRSIEGLSVRETSDLLDLNEVTVKTRLFRARKLLRERFERRFAQAGMHVYEFAGERCDRLTAAVMARVDPARYPAPCGCPDNPVLPSL